SLILPSKYMAETKILTPQQGSSSMASQFINQLGGAGVFAGGALGVKTPNDLYTEMLKSRAVLDRVIDRFDLTNSYKTKSREDVRSMLVKEMLSAKDDKKSGIITIGVEDKNPQKAADLANAFVEELKNVSQGLAVTEAAGRRLFFEEQLKDAKEALIKSEESLRGFQERTGAVKMDEQAKAVIEGMAQLRAQIAAKEVELKVMRTYSTASNPDLQKTEEALKGLKAELGKLEARGGGKHDTFMPAGRMPEIGTEYTRKIRDFKFNETLYGLLTQQFEAAKLDEARDSAIIQVIDKAIPPERRFKPKRTQMVMVAGISGFVISVFIAFFMEFIEKSSENPETRQRFETIKKYVKIK
ncbi:MAG: chain length determinant family protein, partial [Nitrospirae bacterium]|nr:chain length determinant family protein [Nitrospirota bacterium]